MIVQHDPIKPNEVVSIDQDDQRFLKISQFEFPGGKCSSLAIDLTLYQGGPFRLYLEKDGTLSTELYRGHYWLLAEAQLPEKRYETVPTGQVDENGQPVTQMVECPLDLNNVDIIVFPLPEVE